MNENGKQVRLRIKKKKIQNKNLDKDGNKGKELRLYMIKV